MKFKKHYSIELTWAFSENFSITKTTKFSNWLKMHKHGQRKKKT